MKTRSTSGVSKSAVLTACFLAALMLVFDAPCHAHDMWITVEQPTVGKPLHALVGWGHAFPETESLDKDNMAPAFVMGPKGRLDVKLGEKQDFFTVTPVSEGSYVVAGGRKESWYTKTPEGRKDLPRSQVPDAVSCTRSAKYVKAVVNVGKAKDAVSTPVAHVLEIVTLKNPADVRPGGDLPVQVLYEGKPLAGAQILATFSGFSKNTSSFAFAGRTDKEGKTEIRCWNSGLWLALVKHELPFPNPAECDTLSYGASLTFEIK